MWFNSEHIDFYFWNHAALMTEGYVCLVDSNAMLNSRTRVKQFMGFEKQDLNTCNFLFCPFNVRNIHWMLYGVMVEEKIAFLFDPLEEGSLKRDARVMGDKLHGIVNKFLFDGLLEFDSECIPNVFQDNDYDCGTFVCMYTAWLTEDGLKESPATAVRNVRQFVEMIPNNESIPKMIGGGAAPLDNSLQEYLSFTEDHFSVFINAYTVSHKHLTVKPMVATAISKGNVTFLRKHVNLNSFVEKEFIYMPALVENRKWVLFVADLVQHHISVLDPTVDIIDENLLIRMKMAAKYIEHLCLTKTEMKINVFGQPHQLMRNSCATGLMVGGFIHVPMDDRDLFDINFQKNKQKIVPLLLKAKKNGPPSSNKQRHPHVYILLSSY